MTARDSERLEVHGLVNTTVVLVDIETSILLQPSLNTVHW